MRPVETPVHPGSRQEADCVLVCARDETQEQRRAGEAAGPGSECPRKSRAGHPTCPTEPQLCTTPPSGSSLPAGLTTCKASAHSHKHSPFKTLITEHTGGTDQRYQRELFPL